MIAECNGVGEKWHENDLTKREGSLEAVGSTNFRVTQGTDAGMARPHFQLSRYHDDPLFRLPTACKHATLTPSQAHQGAAGVPRVRSSREQQGMCVSCTGGSTLVLKRSLSMWTDTDGTRHGAETVGHLYENFHTTVASRSGRSL